MDAPPWTPDADPEPDDDEPPTVTAHCTEDDLYVFTEADNDDGWIVTDCVTEPRP
ncbi:hypothetical protein VB773_11530 [Haloarculaceae archaeon H-GB2-1]|nr:hypothetical protein [Haloarculaceae archaeon H-GB1-1]MEA5386607.1 hypothetical protein [Haloarculaceae archaeon H-GB11]MEA5408124.1 hypothetical protein [Haloarculaceae archaeon H-GB2-1]